MIEAESITCVALPSREPPTGAKDLMKRRAANIFVLVLLSGCTSILETHPINSSDAVGVPYSLPRTVLEFQITITPKVEEKTAILQFVQATLQATPKYVGDPDKQYILGHNTSGFYDDKFDVEVNERGLLTTLNATTEDKTLAAITELSKGIVDFAKLASGLGGFSVQAEMPPLEKAFQAAGTSLAAQLQRYAGTYTVHVQLPASNGSRLPSISIFGDQSGWYLNVSLQRVVGVQGGAPPPLGEPRDGSLDTTEKIGGILVRTPQAHLLQMDLRWTGSAMLTKRNEQGSVETWTSEDETELARRAAAVGLVTRKTDDNIVLGLPDPLAHASGIVIVPDYGPVVRIPLDRALFAKADYKLVLHDGMVATHNVERGNAVVDAAMLPVTLVKEIVKIPSELVQFKFDLTKSEQELKEKQQEIADKAAARDASKEQDKVAAMKAYFEAETAATLAQNKFKQLTLQGGVPYNDLLAAWSASSVPILP
jgi:hypothetical protein